MLRKRDASTRRRRGAAARRLAAASLLAGALACGRDEAQREYFAALAGERVGAPLEEQIAHLERAIALAPDRGPYWEARGGKRIGLGDLAGAEADFDRAIALRDRPYLRFERALVRCLRADPARALDDLDLAISLQPENTQFYRRRALARLAVGRAEDALADAEHLVSAEPLDAAARYVRGAVLLALGRPREAIGDLDEALRRAPDLVYAWHARAEARERLGDRAGAEADRVQAGQKAYERSGFAAFLNPFY